MILLQLSYGALKRVMSWRLAKNSYPSSTTFAKEYAKSIMQESLGAGLELLQFLLQLLSAPLPQLRHTTQKLFFPPSDLMSSTDQVHLMLPEVMRSDNVRQQAQGSKKFLAHLVLPSICKNVETTSGPKMKETPRSFSAQPAMSWQRLAMLHANRPSM